MKIRHPTTLRHPVSLRESGSERETHTLSKTRSWMLLETNEVDSIEQVDSTNLCFLNSFPLAAQPVDQYINTHVYIYICTSIYAYVHT